MIPDAPIYKAGVIAASLAALLAGALLLERWSHSPRDGHSITIVSWGGNYEENQRAAFFEPFTEASGVTVHVEEWGETIGPMVAQVEAQRVVWDVVVGDALIAAKGCSQGFLEEISPADLADGGDPTALVKDFIPGALSPCGVGTVVSMMSVAYDRKHLATQPQRAADFFDLEKYPGKRGIRRTPEYTLELALLADGVPPGSLYEVLGTSAGVERALRKLDSIKPRIVWYDSFAQSLQLLNDGEVAMTTTATTRLLQPILREHKPWAFVAAAGLYIPDMWMIPKGTPHRKQALAFIRYASQADRIAAIAQRGGYGPARISANALIGVDPTTGADMKSYLVTAPQLLATVPVQDATFWADHSDALNKRFDAWINQ